MLTAVPQAFGFLVVLSYAIHIHVFLWQIPSIHVDPLEEPVVDVAVGGYDLPYQPEGFVSVWIVTINGRVGKELKLMLKVQPCNGRSKFKQMILTRIVNIQLLYRRGVNRLSPEGTSWEVISLDDEEEVQAVAAGPTGMVWVITWAGTLLARTEVSWQNPKGNSCFK